VIGKHLRVIMVSYIGGNKSEYSNAKREVVGTWLLLWARLSELSLRSTSYRGCKKNKKK